LNALHKKKGGFYAIIDSAGVLYKNAFSDQPMQNMNEMISVNLMGCVYIAKYGLPLIQKGGHLINLISSSSTRGRASYAIYSASKAAVLNLTQGLAEEFPDIHINAISPQRTATPLRLKAFGQEDQSTLLKPEEVADAILSILNQKVTGQIFDVRLERQSKRRRKS
jgi:2-C-methyl-D-erythritol 4-phosphate cytidylyltransferase